MSEWRHTDDEDGRCTIVIPTWGQQITGCGCTTPTPDPTSLCGFVAEGMHVPCGMYDIAACHGVFTTRQADYGAHTYVPTRCTCGHTIERTRR